MSAATENANTMAPGTNTPASSGLRHNVYRSKYVVAAASVIGGLLVWEIVSRFFIANALFLAAPSQVAMAIYRLAATGELGQHIVISAAEFALGYVIASVLGVALGLGMAASGVVKEAMQPWISGLYATPTIALAPLFI